jgi:hypothetical protein
MIDSAAAAIAVGSGGCSGSSRRSATASARPCGAVSFWPNVSKSLSIRSRRTANESFVSLAEGVELMTAKPRRSA